MKYNTGNWRFVEDLNVLRPGEGATKAPFINCSVIKIFDLAKVPVTFVELDIQQLKCVLTMLKNSEKNGTEEIGLVTPTPEEIL